jgi:hypothetical protein
MANADKDNNDDKRTPRQGCPLTQGNPSTATPRRHVPRRGSRRHLATVQDERPSTRPAFDRDFPSLHCRHLTLRYRVERKHTLDELFDEVFDGVRIWRAAPSWSSTGEASPTCVFDGVTLRRSRLFDGQSLRRCIPRRAKHFDGRTVRRIVVSSGKLFDG